MCTCCRFFLSVCVPVSQHPVCCSAPLTSSSFLPLSLPPPHISSPPPLCIHKHTQKMKAIKLSPNEESVCVCVSPCSLCSSCCLSLVKYLRALSSSKLSSDPSHTRSLTQYMDTNLVSLLLLGGGLFSDREILTKY